MLACVEYVGRFPGQAAHGNSKYKANMYERTSGTVMPQIGEGCKTNKPKAVFQCLDLANVDALEPASHDRRQRLKY